METLKHVTLILIAAMALALAIRFGINGNDTFSYTGDTGRGQYLERHWITGKLRLCRYRLSFPAAPRAPDMLDAWLEYSGLKEKEKDPAFERFLIERYGSTDPFPPAPPEKDGVECTAWK